MIHYNYLEIIIVFLLSIPQVDFILYSIRLHKSVLHIFYNFLIYMSLFQHDNARKKGNRQIRSAEGNRKDGSSACSLQ